MLIWNTLELMCRYSVLTQPLCVPSCLMLLTPDKTDWGHETDTYPKPQALNPSTPESLNPIP